MLENSTLIKAFKGIKSAKPPLWFMRQAGRYLPEYRELRKRYKMLELIRTPELAAEVTLQPLKRFDLDAAIIYADILNPLIGMGIELDFVDGEGPKIFNPISSLADIERLIVPDTEENVGYTLKAIKIVSSELSSKGIPVIGFAGSPFTLACYLINQGGSAKNYLAAKQFIFSDPPRWQKLQDKLINLISSYLTAQVKAGASALQLFDSWVGVLSPLEFQQYVLPGLIELTNRVKNSCEVPLCYFGTAASGLFPYMQDLNVDVLGVDWRLDLAAADQLQKGRCSLQGNLDPALLAVGGDILEREVYNIVEQGAKLNRAHIFNVGHGLTPECQIDLIESVIRIVKG